MTMILIFNEFMFHEIIFGISMLSNFLSVFKKKSFHMW